MDDAPGYCNVTCMQSKSTWHQRMPPQPARTDEESSQLAVLASLVQMAAPATVDICTYQDQVHAWHCFGARPNNFFLQNQNFCLEGLIRPSVARGLPGPPGFSDLAQIDVSARLRKQKTRI